MSLLVTNEVKKNFVDYKSFVSFVRDKNPEDRKRICLRLFFMFLVNKRSDLLYRLVDYCYDHSASEVLMNSSDCHDFILGLYEEMNSMRDVMDKDIVPIIFNEKIMKKVLHAKDFYSVVEIFLTFLSLKDDLNRLLHFRLVKRFPNAKPFVTLPAADIDSFLYYNVPDDDKFTHKNSPMAFMNSFIRDLNPEKFLFEPIDAIDTDRILKYADARTLLLFFLRAIDYTLKTKNYRYIFSIVATLRTQILFKKLIDVTCRHLTGNKLSRMLNSYLFFVMLEDSARYKRESDIRYILDTGKVNLKLSIYDSRFDITFFDLIVSKQGYIIISHIFSNKEILNTDKNKDFIIKWYEIAVLKRPSRERLYHSIKNV